MATQDKTVTLDQLNKKMVDLAAATTVIQNSADAESRQLNEEERKQTASIQAQFAEVEQEILLREGNARMEAALRQPQPRLTKPVDLPTDNTHATARPALSITGGMASGSTKGTWGFRSFGEYAISARKHHHGHSDARIMNAPTTYGSEGVGSDGGFAVPPDFRTNIMVQIAGEDSLLSRTDQQTTSSNTLVLPRDTVSPWDTSNGVQVRWLGEGAAFTQSKPSLAKVKCELHKIGALVVLTEELLEDAAALTGWLGSKLPQKFTSTINDAIVNGDENGKPLGIMKSAAKITVSEEVDQTAGTINTTNITKMWARMYGQSRRNAVWLLNQDIEPQLLTLTVPGTSPAFPAYLPPGGLSQSPYATLLGRPLIPVESCASVGTEGDLILTDLTQYLTAMKSNGMRSDTSIHLYFDTGHTAMRFEMRLGGLPYWNAPLTRENGSNTLSPIVTLQTRS